MSSDNLLVIDDVTTDLVRVLEAVDELHNNEGMASYERVHDATSGELNLHLLSYIRFLEDASLLTYDRIGDDMEVTEEGDQIRLAPDEIRDAAREAFADRLEDAAVDADGVDPEMGLNTEEEFADVFGEPVDDVDAAGDGGGQSTSAQKLDDGDEATAGGGSFGGDGAMAGDKGAFEEPSSAASTHDSDENASPEEGPSNSVPNEEKSMNGEVEVSASDPEWSASSEESQMGQEAFERIEEIGSGGIGTVYRGRQVRLDREVAIKEIREIFNVFAGVQRDDIIARFQSIVETQASLLHPNIVQLIDVDTAAEYPFSVMQYAPNGSLRRLIEHGDRPPLKVSLKYFLQMLHAINTAHDQGVVHGSLKPENVVLDQAGNALVTDFGISKIVERDGGRGNQVYVGVGSVAYMSPEQFQDPNLATIQSDIYSLGIMFYEMLTGKVPGRRSPMPSSFYPDIPRALDDIFDKMSMDREEDRYEAVDQIIADLHRAEAVLELLDKRSGVLFLRDPMTHGEFGLGEDVDLEGESDGAGAPVEAAGGDESTVDDAEVEAEAEVEVDDAEVEVDDAEVEVDDAEEGDEEASDVDDDDASQEEVSGESDGEEEATEESDGDDEEVLDKLDKYGEMFEE